MWLTQGRQSTSEEDVIDEEEFVLLKQERDAKRSYRFLLYSALCFMICCSFIVVLFWFD